MMWTKLLLLLGLFYLSDCVTVKVGDHTFSLETVKEFKAMFHKSNRALHPDISVCQNKGLPKQLKELCHKESPAETLKTLKGLERICENMDACEICAFAACSGC